MTFETFGLSRDPFAADAAGDADAALFAAAGAERAQAGLLQAITDAAPPLLGRGSTPTRLVLFVGAAGVGKTTLIESAGRTLEHQGWRVATWNAEQTAQQPYVSAVSLLETAFTATPVSIHLAAEHTAVAGVSVVRPQLGGLDRPTVLIVDDADALIDPTIEDLFQVKAEGGLRGDRCLCLVLVGTPALVERCRDMFEGSARAAVKDEIRLVRMQGLSADEMQGYLAHRLAAAGAADASVFSADAVSRMFAYSRGLPAVINRLGQAALALAEARGHRVVEAGLLDEAALDCWLDEEKVAYSGIDDLATEEPASPLPPGGDDLPLVPPSPVEACADQDEPLILVPTQAPEAATETEAQGEPEPEVEAAAHGGAAAPASASPASGAPPADQAAPVAAAAAPPDAEEQGAAPVPLPPLPPPPDQGETAQPVPPATLPERLAQLFARVRATTGASGKTIALVGAVGGLLVIGTATLLRQLAEPGPNRAAETTRPASAPGQTAAPAPSASPPQGSVPPPAAPALPTTAAAAPSGEAVSPAAGVSGAGASGAGASGGGVAPSLKPPGEPPSPPLAPTAPVAETDSLIDRGQRLVSLGDVAAARRFFEVAARRGDGRGSSLLARTYDPLFYAGNGVSGTRPDPAKAVRWYAEAERQGAPGAGERLRALTVDPAARP